MGHSQADKAATHERILAIAAERFREAGVDGLSVADLMKAAGLTHGGFYKHFRSREDLVAQAVTRALGESRTRMAAAGERTRAALIDTYLDPTHRDDIGHGCAITALSADMARAGADARAPFTQAIAANIEAIARLDSAPGDADARARAITTLSALVGALSLARAVDDPALSDEILAAVTTNLKSD